MEQNYFDIVFGFVRFYLLITLGASSLSVLWKSFKRYDELFVDVPVAELNSQEQVRLDSLLLSAKKYYNYSLVLAGVSLLISTLDSFSSYQLPYGGLDIPQEQTILGLYILTVLSLAVSDRFFLMALPWLKLDVRRVPVDWLVMGLSFEKRIKIGFWFSIPLLLSSVSSGILLGGEGDSLGYVLFYFAGYGLTYLPRAIYYWSYLIDERKDHRGGLSTLSMNLLYRYRLVRQVIFSFYYVYPLTLVIPNWNGELVQVFYDYVIIFFGIIYALREIGSIKRVRRWIDSLGKKFGFAMVSAHYK